MVTKIEPLGASVIPSNDDVGAYNIIFQRITDDSIKIEYVQTMEPEVLSDVLIGSLRDGRLKVLSPIKVKFNTEGKYTIAEAVEINEFGFGGNMTEAIVDLQHTIAELYHTLEEKQDKLGVDLQGVWSVLQQKICKR